MTSSNVLFCPTNSLNLTDTPFIITSDEEKQHISPFKKLKRMFCFVFYIKKNNFSKIVGAYFFVNHHISLILVQFV